MGFLDTLLLDQGFMPVKVIPWQRAICMQFVGKVEVIVAHERLVHSIARAFEVPSVVRLLHRAVTRPMHVRFSRDNVYLRDDHRCQYCGLKCGSRELTLDHVVPRSRGGTSTWRNIVTACADCNRRKGRNSPEEAGMHLRSVPRKPTWLGPRLHHLRDEHIPTAWRDWLRVIPRRAERG